MKLKREILEMAGIISESETIKEKYKTITSKEIGDMLRKLYAKLPILDYHTRNESQKIEKIIALLIEFNRTKKKYDDLNTKEHKTDSDLHNLEELNNKMKQMWNRYLDAVNKKR